MQISIILAHPDSGSLNHAIAHEAAKTLEQNGHMVRFHDLYGEEFPPNLPAKEIPRTAELPEIIATHCRELAEADGIIVVHPNWWGMPPAILKGWVDRIVRPGLAYEFLEQDQGEGVPVGLLKADTALVFNTSNTESEREQKVFGDPLETIWKNCIFDLCGCRNFHRRMFNIIVISSEEQRHQWLAEVRALVAEQFPPD